MKYILQPHLHWLKTVNTISLSAYNKICAFIVAHSESVCNSVKIALQFAGFFHLIWNQPSYILQLEGWVYKSVSISKNLWIFDFFFLPHNSALASSEPKTMKQNTFWMAAVWEVLRFIFPSQITKQIINIFIKW